MIRDNGRGFDFDKILPGFGIRSMQERARELGGYLDLESANGEGTLITLVLELDDHNEEY